MLMDYDLTEQVLGALGSEGVSYAIFGGTALNLHGIARFTEDVDLFIAPARDHIERLKNALRNVFDDPELDGISADDLLGEYPRAGSAAIEKRRLRRLPHFKALRRAKAPRRSTPGPCPTCDA